MVMRLLIILALVAATVWLLRRSALTRSRHADAEPRREVATDVLRCTHCSLHIPSEEAVMSSSGMPFCSPAHQQQYEQS